MRHSSEFRVLNHFAGESSLRSRCPKRQKSLTVQSCAEDQLPKTDTPQESETNRGHLTAPGSSIEAQTIDGLIVQAVEKPNHEVDLEASILNILGPEIVPEKVTGTAIHKDVALRWTKIIDRRLSAEETRDLIEKYPVPANCTIIDAPKLNVEVKASIQTGTVLRDDRIVEKQKQIASCLTGIGHAISISLKLQVPEKLKILEHLGTAGQLLSSIQRDEAIIRKSLIQTNINISLKETLANAPTGEWLFGDELEERLNTAKSLERTSKELKLPQRPQPPKASKNSIAPPRQPSTAPKNYQATSGGYRRTYPNKSDQRGPYQRKDRQQDRQPRKRR